MNLNKESEKFNPYFTIAIDSREQHPWTFNHMPPTKADRDRGRQVNVKKQVQYLNEGDYAIVEAPKAVAVERKSLEDLYSTLGSARARFEDEICRLQDGYDFAAVLIESSWWSVINPQVNRENWRSKLNPRSVYATIISWSHRYPKVHWMPMGSRRMAEITCFEILKKAWKRFSDKQ